MEALIRLFVLACLLTMLVAAIALSASLLAILQERLPQFAQWRAGNSGKINHSGGDWLRRRSRNHRSMPRCRVPR